MKWKILFLKIEKIGNFTSRYIFQIKFLLYQIKWLNVKISRGDGNIEILFDISLKIHFSIECATKGALLCTEQFYCDKSDLLRY